MRGVASQQFVIKKRRDFQPSPEIYALSVHSGLVLELYLFAPAVGQNFEP